MSGHIRRIGCCDGECAFVNGCVVGGIECEGCEKYFCAEDLNGEGMCEECADSAAHAEQEGEDEEA